ncbi:MAG: hypothetical protein K9N06_02975 [Candidatus Cloacimonetes bacterium]|nr:hypothetical protein [Candidatus Cloacimonadota bacterium]
MEKIKEKEYYSDFEYSRLLNENRGLITSGYILELTKDSFVVMLENNSEKVNITASMKRFREEDIGKLILLIKLRDDYIALGRLYQKPEHIITKEEEETEELVIKKKSVKIDVYKDIELNNGKGSVSIKSDGKVIVKGENVTTRARRINKIRGAAIELN